MQKSNSLDQYKIPAFQRKRSLAAKARRKRVPVTAFEKRIAGIPVVKPKRRRMVRSVVLGRSIAAGSLARRRAVGSRAVSFGVESLEGERFSSPLIEEERGYSGSLVDEEESGYPCSQISEEERNFLSPLVKGLELREMRLCGKIEGYIFKIEVAIVTVKASIRTGDRLIFESHEGGLFEQTLESMQINREDVATAYSGDDVGIKVLAEPKKNGNVYKVV